MRTGTDAEQTERLPSASTVKRKNWVALKQSTSSMCPATMFMSNRRVSVTGRRMNVERNSSSARNGTRTIGTPGMISWFLK